MPSVAEILAQAKAYLAAGNLPSAEQLCRSVLQVDAANVEACHLLGIVCQGLGKTNEAIACLERAIRLKPGYAEAHDHLGTLLAAQGKLDEAIGNFEQACRLRPESAEMSNHLRYALVTKNNRWGNELAAQGKLDEAVACYRRALELVPDIAELQNNLGTVLAEQGQVDEAAACFRRALELNPNFAEAHSNLGAELAKQKKPDEAASCFRRALGLKPGYAKAHHNLGAVLADLGQLDEAAACCGRALQLEPDLAAAHNTLALVLREQDKLAEAAVCGRRAVELAPDFAEAHANLGLISAKQERLDDAAAHYRRALELKPGAAEVLNNLGGVLVELEKLPEAATCFRRILELNPNSAQAHFNLAGVLTKQDESDEAIAEFRRALALEPDNDQMHYSLGAALGEQKKLDEAAACFRRAIALKPGNGDAHHGYASALLLMAQFAEGWSEFEWRFTLKGYELPGCPQPRWDGTGLAGRTILLHTEGGRGDGLHFIRYAELVKQQGGTVIVECRRELARLFATCAGVDDIAVRGERSCKFDVYVPMLSLPGIFGTSLENIPAKVPYLWPDQELVEQWKDELSDVKELRVGIVWQGNPGHAADRLRSISLSHFSGIARLPGIRLYSLQMGASAEQLSELAGPITDLGDRLGDFYNTAAIMRNLDLVISCDSAPAHLAGAVGVPVWVALAFAPDWRWMLDRTDSPWYPTMRLFRQSAHRDWDGVLGRMEEALARMVRLKTR